MDMNIYERQELVNLGISYPGGPVAVIGTGGVGTWTAILLALSRVTELILIDGDTVQPENLNRLPFTLEDIDRPKVEVLKKFIHRIRPETKITALPVFLDETTIDLLAECGVVICTTDTLASQELLSSYCAEHDKTFIKAGCDSNHVTVCHELPEWEGTGQEGYTIPSWVVPTAFAACLAVFKALVNPDLDFCGSLWDVGTRIERQEEKEEVE